MKNNLKHSLNLHSEIDIEYRPTFESIEDLENFDRVLSYTSNKATQIFRGNNGGGMPCPDSVCKKPSLLDNF